MKEFFKAIGIGSLAGFLPAFLLIILITLWASGLGIGEFLSLGIIAMPSVVIGILGALIGWYWRKTKQSMWVGGLIGGIIAIPALILFAFYSGNGCFLGC